MISISTMSIHCLGPTLGLVFYMSFIIICGNFGETDGYEYNEELSTVGKIVTKTGSTIWLHWNFTLKPSQDTLTSFECGYNDTTGITGKELVSLAIQTGSNNLFIKASSIPSSYTGRVKVFSSNYTIAVQELEFSDQKPYYCKINYDFKPSANIIPITDSLPYANVEVQGAPEFCAPNASPLSVSLGEKANITVTICVNPFDALVYQWNHQTTKTTHKVQVTKIGINKYQDSFITNALTKDYCGRVLSLYSINNFGRSMSRNITINVLFDPSKPNDIQAFKTNATCYKVQWKHENTGNCVVSYTIDLKDKSESKWKRTVDASIESLLACPTVATNITDADVKVDTLNGSLTYSVKVMSTTPAPPTRASTEGSTLTSSSTVQTNANATAAALTDDSTTWKIGVGISCALIFIGVIILCYCVKKRYDSKTDASTTWIIVGVVVGIVVAVVMAILCYVLREKGATATWATVGVGVVIIIVVFIVCYLCRKRAICKTGPKYDDSAETPQRDNGSNLPLSQRNNPSETQYQQPNVRPPKGSHEPAQYAQTNSDQLLYGRLGEGGGRGTRSAKASKPSEDLYADVKLDEKGYPAQGPTTTYR